MSATEVDGWPETCGRGHQLDAANLYVPPNGRRWHCRCCRRYWQRGGLPPIDHRRLEFSPLDDASAEALAQRYGVSRRTICRWRADGIPWRHAEEAAELLGVHPCELWDDFYSIENAA